MTCLYCHNAIPHDCADSDWRGRTRPAHWVPIVAAVVALLLILGVVGAMT